MTNYYRNRSLDLLAKAVSDHPNLDISTVIITKEAGKRAVFTDIKCNKHGQLAPYDTHRLSVFTGCRHCNLENRRNRPKKDKAHNYTPKRVAALFDRIVKSFSKFDKAVSLSADKKNRPLYGVKKGSQEWIEYYQSEEVRKRASINGRKAKGMGIEGVQSYLINRSNTYSYVGLYRLLLTDGTTVLKVGFSNPQNGNKPRYRGKGIEVIRGLYNQ